MDTVWRKPSTWLFIIGLVVGFGLVFVGVIPTFSGDYTKIPILMVGAFIVVFCASIAGALRKQGR